MEPGRIPSEKEVRLILDAKLKSGFNVPYIRSHKCQRCGGNLFLEHDAYGLYVACMQCGGVYAEYDEEEINQSNSRLPVAASDSHEQ